VDEAMRWSYGMVCIVNLDRLEAVIVEQWHPPLSAPHVCSPRIRERCLYISFQSSAPTSATPSSSKASNNTKTT
jgi:hypothetical protein